LFNGNKGLPQAPKKSKKEGTRLPKMTSGSTFPTIPMIQTTQKHFDGCLVDTGLLIAATARHITEPGSNSRLDSEVQTYADSKKIRGLLGKLLDREKIIVPHCVIETYKSLIRGKAAASELSDFNYGTHQGIVKILEAFAGDDPLKNPALREQATAERKEVLLQVLLVIRSFENYCHQHPEDKEALEISLRMDASGSQNLGSRIEIAIKGPNAHDLKKIQEIEAAQKFLSTHSRDTTPSSIITEKTQLIQEHRHLVDKYDLRKQTWQDAEFLVISHHANSAKGYKSIGILTNNPQLEHLQRCVSEQIPGLIDKADVFTKSKLDAFLSQAKSMTSEKLVKTAQSLPKKSDGSPNLKV
jgi:hypothetical protein